MVEHLRKRIAHSTQYRADVHAKIAHLEHELAAGISSIYSVVHEGKQLRLNTAELKAHYAQWLRYYDGLIAKDTKAIQAHEAKQTYDAKQVHETKQASRWKHLPLLIGIMLSMVALFAVTQLDPSLTGFVVKQPKLYTDTVDRMFTESGTWLFTPEQQQIDERITSLKLSGTVEGTGTARVLLDGKVIIEYTLTPVPTPEQPIAPEPTAPEQPAPTDTGTNATTETITETTTETGTQPAGLGDLTGAVVLDTASEKFTLECVDTCTLDIPRSDAYALTVEVDGVQLIIDTASYTTEKVSAQGTSATAQNITAQNVTVQNASITANGTTMTWTPVPKYGQDSTGKQSTTTYTDIEGSNKTLFTNKIGAMEVVAIIPADASGTLMAKYDYVNVRYIKLAVEAEGVVSLALADSDGSIVIETGKVYNDGLSHTIRAVLSQSTAAIEVDGVKEAEESIASLQDVDTGKPVSVGSNIGYLEWFGEPVESFTGTITSAKVEYKEATS